MLVLGLSLPLMLKRILSWLFSAFLPARDDPDWLNKLLNLVMQRKGAGEDDKWQGAKNWWGGCRAVDGRLRWGRWGSCFRVKEMDGREKEMSKIYYYGFLISPYRVQESQEKSWDLWKLFLSAGLYYFNHNSVLRLSHESTGFKKISCWWGTPHSHRDLGAQGGR